LTSKPFIKAIWFWVNIAPPYGRIGHDFVWLPHELGGEHMNCNSPRFSLISISGP
jgi:hypothetical protein